MLRTLEGLYQDGQVKLKRKPRGIRKARVLVTFLPVEAKRAPKLSSQELVELRGKLASWEEDWNAPGMEAYDEA